MKPILEFFNKIRRDMNLQKDQIFTLLLQLDYVILIFTILFSTLFNDFTFGFGVIIFIVASVAAFIGGYIVDHFDSKKYLTLLNVLSAIFSVLLLLFNSLRILFGSIVIFLLILNAVLTINWLISQTTS